MLVSAVKKKRYPALAVVLALCGGGGIGQLYNGEGRKGVVFFIMQCVLFFLNYFIDSSSAVKIWLCAFLGFNAIVVFDAFFGARRAGDLSLRWYNKFHVYFAVWVMPIIGLMFFTYWVSFSVTDWVKSIDPYDCYKATGSSMFPTLIPGDYFFADLDYYRKFKPRRGDIVVLKESPESPARVQRVIGLAGDTIEVKGKQLFINSYLYEENYAVYSEGGLFDGRFVVTEGHVFLLGDNRDHSRDSRFAQEQFRVDQVVAKVLFVYLSVSDWRRIGKALD